MAAAAPDLEIVRLARAGNSAAWDQLFKRYQRPLYAFVCELLNEEAAALDVVQESFINAHRYVDSLRNDAHFGSWLFGIAHQKCQQQIRIRVRNYRMWDTREPPPLSEEPIDIDLSQLDPAAWLIREEDEAEFLDCLNQLPESHRAILLLRFVDDFSLVDIARITEVPLGTVKSRLHHARRFFRKLFIDTCYEKPT